MRDSLAVVQNGLSIQVLDVRDLAAPALLGEVYLGTGVSEVALQGPYAYLSTGRCLTVVDLSDPAHPRLRGSAPDRCPASQCLVSGTRAYVGTAWGSVRIYDMADPDNPQLLGWAPVAGERVLSLALYQDRVLYVGTDGAYLTILDVSDPTQPQVVATPLYGGWWCGALELRGDLLYAASWGGPQFLVLDISGPFDPVPVGRLDLLGGRPTGMALQGPSVFVPLADSGLVVVNVRDPSDPWVVGHLDRPFNQGVQTYSNWAIALDGGRAYIAVYSGLWIVDVDTPWQPASAGYYPTGPCGCRGDFQGPYLYITSWLSGLFTVDNSDPTHPRRVGYSPTGVLGGEDVAVRGDYAYVVNAEELWVVDVRDPARPRPVAVRRDLVHPTQWVDWHRITLADSVLLIAQPDSGLILLDLSDPTDPQPVGFYATEEIRAWEHSFTDVAGSASYAYVAAMSDGLMILDISDPANPHLAGNLRGPWRVSASGVTVQDSLAYVSAAGGLAIVSVADPAAPRLLGHIATGGSGGVDAMVAVEDTLVLLSYGDLAIINVAEPWAPRIIQYLDGSAFGWRGELAYVAHYGLLIYSPPGLTGGLPPEGPTLPAARPWLLPPAPNPFQGTTTLQLALPEAREGELVIYDLRGRVVATPLRGLLPAGSQVLTWDAAGLPSGIYFCRLRAGGRTETRKIVRVR